MTEPDEGEGWRVRLGVSLLAAAPLSDALREAHRKEDEKERAQLEREAEQRRADAAERAADLAFRGVVPRTPAEVFEQVSFAQDRQDAVEARREREAAELLGRPKPTVHKLLADAAAERKQREAELEATPASKAEVERKFDKLKTTIENTFGKRLLK
jgi:hypothetical protein